MREGGGNEQRREKIRECKAIVDWVFCFVESECVLVIYFWNSLCSHYIEKQECIRTGD